LLLNVTKIVNKKGFMNKKKKVALISLFMAILLVLGKAIVGFATGSLGILSEAAHSALDLLATILTLFAVTKAAKPPDEEHPYGHEKIENLSALFETLFLVVTCIWIIYEAFVRLTGEPKPIIVNFWSYFVVVSAILIDFWRSRALFRTARETHSPALEADAINFSSDIGSSAVVLIGLIASQMGFNKADSIAAMVVAVIVLFITAKLGMKSIGALIDQIPKGAMERAELSARSVEGVAGVYDIKVREAGDAQFVEMKVKMDSGLPFGEVHRITSEIENAVGRSFSNARIIVHPEPEEGKGGMYEHALRLSESVGARLHDFTVFETSEGVEVSLHLEWKGDTIFGEAWKKTKEVELRLQESYPAIKSFFIHFEPIQENLSSSFELKESSLKDDIEKRLAELPQPLSRTNVRFIKSEGVLHIHLTFPVSKELSVGDVHDLSSQVENIVIPMTPERSHVVSQPTPLDQFKKSM
jgi:cation diffusion facilitator family transporter